MFPGSKKKPSILEVFLNEIGHFTSLIYMEKEVGGGPAQASLTWGLGGEAVEEPF